MFCSKCGKQVETTARFCGTCGTTAPVTHEMLVKTTNYKKIGLIITLAGIVAVTVFFIVSNDTMLLNESPNGDILAEEMSYCSEYRLNGDTGNCSVAEIPLVMTTGGTAGTYYPFGGAMASVISNHTNANVTIVASGASVDNIQQIGLGNAHLALAQNDIMYYASHGVGIWPETAPVTNLATLMTLYPETIQIVVEANSGIYSVADLASRRVSIGVPGSGVEANAIQILAAYGISRDDIIEQNLGFAPSADAMRDGFIDAFFVTAATPNTTIMELAVARDLRIVPIGNAQATSLMADYPFYIRVVIDSSEYSWLDAPVYTLAVQATLIASTSMDEQLAYDIVKALIENASEVEAGHARGADISPYNAVQSISVNFHPGARRFFEEIGAL